MPPLSPVPGWARGEVCSESTAARVTMLVNVTGGPRIPYSATPPPGTAASATPFSRRNDS